MSSTEEVLDQEYERIPIPEVVFEDLSGCERELRELRREGAALLVCASSDREEGRTLLADAVALLTSVPYVKVHAVVENRAEIVGLPVEVRRHTLVDHTGGLRQLWLREKPSAVLLGTDGLLAGGPVHGDSDVRKLVLDIDEALRRIAPPSPVSEDGQTLVAYSVDVLIPFRNTSRARLRNLTTVIRYYRQHLPQARIVVAEHDVVTLLDAGVEPDVHIAVPGDPDLFNRSLLLNEAARHSSAAYLLFADADCIPEPTVLASLEALTIALPDYYVVLHDSVHYLTEEGSDSFRARGGEHDGDDAELLKSTTMRTVGGATFCSADRFQRMGGFDQQKFLGWGGEDDDLYNRCVSSDGKAYCVPAGLLHLHHPATVTHDFTDGEMSDKRAQIPPPDLVSPQTRLQTVQHFMAARKVAFATCSARSTLFEVFSGFSHDIFPDLHVVDGSAGTYGSAAFIELFRDESLTWADYLVYSDEDNFIVDWTSLRETLSIFIQGGYGFAGMPDGGVISHRFHNPIAINPFLSIFDLRAVREALQTSELCGQMGSDLLVHVPAAQLRLWDGTVSHPSVRTVLEEGHMPYGTAFDMFEPYYELWFHLLRQGLKPLYLNARDAPEMDDDGCCTALFAPNGQIISYHTWFARDYHHSPQCRIRINRVAARAHSHVRW